MYSNYFYNSNITLDECLNFSQSNINDSNILQSTEWTDSLENVIKMWGEKAAGNRELHLNSVRHWKKISSYLSIPLIFLTTITSVSTFNAINYEDYAYWMYAAGTVNLIAAFLTSLNKYLKPEEKIQSHYQSAKAFGCFYRKIVLELSLSRSNRESTSILTKWAKNEYDKLIQDSPIVSNKIINNYKTLHTKDTNIPDIVLNDFIIYVNKD